MFGTNPRVGKRQFSGLDGNTLQVTSVLPLTLQGEGPLSGQPSIFVRLAQCNLNCHFCDTYFTRGDLYTYDALQLLIQRRILDHFGASIPDWARWYDHRSRQINLVITGGEPLLQDRLYGFIDRQAGRVAWEHDPHAPPVPQFKAIQIETNGVLEWRGDETTLLVVSPKARERNGVAVAVIKPHPTTLARANALKFVVRAPLFESDPYSSIPDWALQWREDTGRSIYLSPMNIYQQEPRAALLAKRLNTENDINVRSEEMERVSFWEPDLLDQHSNQRNHEYAAALTLVYGATLSLQTHLLASLP